MSTNDILLPSQNRMTPEQIAAEIRYARDAEGANPRAAFLALADLTVSMLRMIDARRESGVKFDASYNENTLRIAVELLAAQEFPPGPPMRSPVFVRNSTALPPLDHVLGGGFVAGSVVLFSAETNVGKTSLTLQMLKGLQHQCLYVTGESTRDQIGVIEQRLGTATHQICVLAERKLSKILEYAREIRAQTIAIDPIQRLICEDIDRRANASTQLKACTSRLIDHAKKTDTAVWLVSLAAVPATIEHSVDAILELTRGAKFEGNERILRCPSKNRFGPTSVVGRFELTAKGFVPVDVAR